MGDRRFDRELYRSATVNRLATGTPDFEYSARMATVARGERVVHPDLDPKRVAGPGSPVAGQNIRESRDSAEHPDSLAIAVQFDVTGSMGTVPKLFQQKLVTLVDVLDKGGLEDAQLLFGAIGDATCDRVPLQIGQFESDNRSDEQLRKVFLEEGGGPGLRESYELAWYFAARKTATDCWDKRQRKGYLFTLGDETFYETVPQAIARKVFNDAGQAELSALELLAEARRRWHVFHVHVQHGTGYDNRSEILLPWRKALGQDLLLLSDPSLACELLATTIAVVEGSTERPGRSRFSGLEMMEDLRLDARGRETIRRAVEPLAARG